MEKILATKTVLSETRSLEFAVRDIMDSMEELANMIGIRASSYSCEILSIEPAVTKCRPGQNSGDMNKTHLNPSRSQVLPFKKQ